MKFRAHIENSVKSETVTIKTVVDGVNSKYPEKWEKRTFYSLKYLTPMYAKPNCKKIRPHFAFKRGLGGNEKSGGGESLEHELAKEIIAKNLFLTIKLGNIQDTLYFSKVIIEQKFNKGKRSADLYVQIKNKNKFDYTIGKGLVIEIHRSNKVSKTKRQFYRNLNIAAIETKIDKFNKLENDIYNIQNQLEKSLTSVNEGVSLHDPFYLKHKIEREKKEKEFQESKRKRRLKELEKENQKILDKQSKVVIKKIEPQNIVIEKKKIISKRKKTFLKRIIDLIKK